MLRSFKPVIDANARILILGTMPGAASLAARQYYAHKQNKFWPVIFAVFEGGRAPLDYADKLAVLQANKIALWDSLEKCRRQGSLDSAIECEVPNKIPALLKKYPNIKKIIFNGQGSFKYFVKHLSPPAIPYEILPSTSPAHATKSFKQKLQAWRKAIK